MLTLSVLLTHYFAGDKIVKNEIGGAFMEKVRNKSRVLVGNLR
jgi:hypothetical protein